MVCLPLILVGKSCSEVEQVEGHLSNQICYISVRSVRDALLQSVIGVQHAGCL